MSSAYIALPHYWGWKDASIVRPKDIQAKLPVRIAKQTSHSLEKHVCFFSQDKPLSHKWQHYDL